MYVCMYAYIVYRNIRNSKEAQVLKFLKFIQISKVYAYMIDKMPIAKMIAEKYIHSNLIVE